MLGMRRETAPDGHIRAVADTVPTAAAITRRRLLAGAAVLGAAHAVGACGSERSQVGQLTVPPEIQPGAAPSSAVPAGSTAPTVAPRGVPAPPGSRWQPGWFITHVEVPEPRLALTFDDGPAPENTPLILDQLRTFDVQATFFVVGMKVQAFPDIARRIVDEGHEIANHSVYHEPYEAVALAGQIGPNQDIIREATGVVPVANRTPGLKRGDVILSMCEVFGLYEAHTTMESTDWIEPFRSASQLVDDFAANVESGAFAVFHDAGELRPTVDAVPGVVAHARSSGYELMTATDLVNSGTPRPGMIDYAGVEGLRRAPTTGPAISRYGLDRRDTRSDLVAVLERGGVTPTTRRRVVEAIADIDAMRRAAHLAS